MKWKVLAIVVLLAGGGVAVAGSFGVFGASASAATSYLTAQASVADVVDQVAATGTIAATTTYGLAFGETAHPSAASSSSSSSSNSGSGNSSVTWPVSTVKVKVGDTVTKGEVLATADTSDLSSQILDADRANRIASTQLATAQDQYDAAAGTTTAAIRQARIGLYSAQTQSDQAKATLASLRAELPLATLTAPEAGTVTGVAIETGIDAPSGDAITMTAGTLEVTTSVVESDVASITVGQPTSITVAALGGASIDGLVASIAPTASSSGNNGVVSFAVEVSLTTVPAGLRPGMSADVTITTASATGVLSVPSRALTGTTGSYRVRVLAADGTVSTKVVTVGLITSSLAEVQSGLQAGDVVITGTSSTQQTTTNRAGGGITNLGGGAAPGGFRGVTP